MEAAPQTDLAWTAHQGHYWLISLAHVPRGHVAPRLLLKTA
jgi:hypothetical protein